MDLKKKQFHHSSLTDDSLLGFTHPIEGAISVMDNNQ